MCKVCSHLWKVKHPLLDFSLHLHVHKSLTTYYRLTPPHCKQYSGTCIPLEYDRLHHKDILTYEAH